MPRRREGLGLTMLSAMVGRHEGKVPVPASGGIWLKEF
jgi:hypothetical protein